MSPHAKSICFTLNGVASTAEVESYETLIDLLGRFDLFGARESCGQGLCGCCTVLVDGRAVSGCLYPARMAAGTALTTIEALDADGNLSPVQQAFIDEGAFQCGFCTPGFVLMTEQLLAADPDPDEATIRTYLSGNLCRCATYPEVIRAVQAVAQRVRAGLTTA